MTEIHGYCDEKFAPVRERFEANFSKKGDVGASVAISLEGEMVVDLWGGHRDEAGLYPWQKDTIVNVYSTTKTMTFLCMLMLADRGEIDLYARVADYWPEFACNGKENTEVRHFLSHSAGLAGVDEALRLEDIYNWDKMVGLLEAQAPWWVPGTASGYHAMTQGYLLGEVVRRVTGKTIGQYFAEEVATPLGADFHIGTGEEHFERIGTLIPPPTNLDEQGDTDPDSMANRALRNPPAAATASATMEWRSAEIPAANGHGNARSVVRAQTPMANGGKAFGVELLSPEGAAQIFDEQIYGKDLVLGAPIKFGMGYGITTDAVPMGPNKNIAYWGGWGGSSVVVDADAHLCVSYVMNKMFAGLLGDTRGYGLLQAAYASL